MTARCVLRVGMLAIGLIAVGTACAPQGTTPKSGEKIPPRPRRAEPRGPLQVGPQLILAPDHRVYATWSSITPGKKLFDVFFSRSDDDGKHWLAAPISLQPEKTRNSGGVHLLADRDGRLYAFYALGLRTPRQEMVLLRSADRGVTWEGPIVIRSGNRLHSSSFLRDRDGTLFAVIPEGSEFDWELEVHRSSDRGTTWEQLPTLETAHEETASGINDFDLRLDDQGRLHVVWPESDGKGPARVFYNLLTPSAGGGSWLPSPIPVSKGGPSSKGVQFPLISLWSDGRVLVSWLDIWNPGPTFEGSFPWKVHVARSLNSGEGWQEPIRLSPSGVKPVLSTAVTVATDGGQQVYVAWIEGDSNRPQHLRFSRSIDGGATWVVPAHLLYKADPESSLGVPLILRADAAGRVYLVWQQLEGERWKLLFTRSLDHGQTWLPKPFQLARTPQFDRGLHSLSFEVDGSRLSVAWDGWLGVDNEIFYTHSSDFGATWLPKDVQISRR
jgi:hypothetical protein